MSDGSVKDFFSAVKLIDVQLVRFLLDIDPSKADYPFTDESKVEISGTYSRREIDDSGNDSCEYMLLVGFEKYPDKGKKSKRKKPSVKVEIVVRGIVVIRFDEGYDEDRKDQILCSNSISLLYGEARSHTMLMTAVSPVDKIILPAIDPWFLAERLLEAKAEKEAAE